ncbi:MAG: pentapeptide repeat-containing protein [Limnospira sp. PMC 737.11]|nr:pentapeptide repeat-containing protein [Limnospira sp. PMC 1252.20]MDT9273412.1 pentapeptide repeat-containing protein [Limnospira sp. PMC 737.11]MDT9283607.1 pentapeptide repeat-containing protein [Limnospira sp. PMC 1298.21]
MRGANWNHANLKGVNLVGADLTETGLMITYLKKAMMPNSEIPRLPTITCKCFSGQLSSFSHYLKVAAILSVY